MKGTNDAWNMYINQCIVKGWLFRAKLIREITLEVIIQLIMNFQMLYTQNHIAHFNENHYASLSGHTGYF